MTDDRTLFHAKPVRMTNATVTSDGRRYDLREIEGPHTDLFTEFTRHALAGEIRR